MAKLRDELEKKYTWDLSPIYSSQEDFDQDFQFLLKEANHHFPLVNFYKNNLKNQLLDALEAYFKYLRKLDKLYICSFKK